MDLNPNATPKRLKRNHPPVDPRPTDYYDRTLEKNQKEKIYKKNL
jgi:hypothetical protein